MTFRSPDAQHQLRRPSRDVSELPGDVAGHRSIDGQKGRLPPDRQLGPQLHDHVGAAGDVCRIGEDRVAQENDVTHAASRRMWARDASR